MHRVNLFKNKILRHPGIVIRLWAILIIVGLIFSAAGCFGQKARPGQPTGDAKVDQGVIAGGGSTASPGPTPGIPSFQAAAGALISGIDIPAGSHIYGLGKPVNPGTELSIQPDFGNAISVRTESPTYFFLIDDAPDMRFAHPVRYVLLEARQQEGTRWKVYSQEWLPVVNGQDWEIQENITVQGKQVTVLKESPTSK